MKIFGICLLSLVTASPSSAQYGKPFANSNYGALQSVSFNPANLADSRYRFALTPATGYVDVSNNFVKLTTPYSQWKVVFNNVPEDQIDSNGFPIFDKSFLTGRLNGNKKRMYASAEIMGPSFMFGLKNKSGVAFTTKTRMFVNVSGLNQDLMKIFMEDFDTSAAGYSPVANQLRLIGKPNTQTNLGLGAMAYQEFAFSYANVLHDKKKNFVKGGVTVKYLIGLAAAYVSMNELSYELIDLDSIRFRSANGTAAYTSDRYFSDPNRRLYNYFGKDKLGRGMGIDLGVIYEFRPDYKEFFYRMDRRKHEDRTVNKYKLKLGASINDFGSIRFNNAPYTQRISIDANGDSVDWANFNRVQRFSGAEDIDSFALDLFPYSTVDSSFSSALPASFNLNADYLLKENWYLSASYIQSLRLNKVKGVRKQNVMSVGARYETRKFEASTNLVFGRFYNPILLGAFVRFGPLYVGSDNLGGVFTAKSTNGFNLYAGVQLPILRNKIPDEDGDGVSDEKDKCLGVFGSDRAKGCPDEDDDRVPDSEDKCPTIAGPKTTKGCPDLDEDGLVGDDDKCPDLPGTKENEGCPDSDGDGVPDHIDACKDEVGKEEYNGCPGPPEKKKEKEKNKNKQKNKDKKKEVVPKPDPSPKKVEPKPTPDKEVKTVHDVIDLMDFDTYDYYLILGAYKNKNLADNLVKRLNREAGILTYIYFDETNEMNYVTFGRTTGKEQAKRQLDLLTQPKVESRINGHVWWKKVVK